MRIRPMLTAAVLALNLVFFAGVAGAQGSGVPATSTRQAAAQAVFPTPEAAATALATAVRDGNTRSLLAVVGSEARAWLSSGDPVADRHDWRDFLAAYDVRREIRLLSEQRAQLLVGEGEWPFPAPLVLAKGGWRFDAVAGGEEVINRRVGRNELDAMQTLLAIVDAQREFAATDADGNGFNDYALRFRSSEGRRDGLYWQQLEGQPPSPLGPLVGMASREGYALREKGAAYHGYRYRILSAQGSEAKGGAYDYLVDGKLLGGFAVLAYPVKYGVSGVMTFLVNHDGVVWERDLGAETGKRAEALQRFNPGKGWRRAQQ